MRELGVFAKYWQPGNVKTRLAASIGDEAAARVHRESLAVILRRFQAATERSVLAHDPPERAGDFQSLAGNGWQLRPQASGDLGQRLRTHFAAGFVAGVTSIVVVGSDSPTLPAEYVERAFAALEQRSVVLGPSEDGGYYLIGLRGPLDSLVAETLFNNIPWSTPHVFERTIARLTAAGIPYSVLPSWYDVDEVADLRRLNEELVKLAPLDEVWHALAEEVRRALGG